ncbi:MAG: F0F1 ATP synthase subunit delta [Parcubacteria group bacterium]|nr:F0F1 ATP synthase subunit delta [Parcubacteria group bacterium]
MRCSTKQYAQAFFVAMEGKGEKDQKKIMGHFLTTIRKNGDTPRLHGIMREVEKQYYKQQGAHKIEVESAIPLSVSTKKQILGMVSHGVIAREGIDASLVGGVTICVDDETFIDASIKSQLQKLFSH